MVKGTSAKQRLIYRMLSQAMSPRDDSWQVNGVSKQEKLGRSRRTDKDRPTSKYASRFWTHCSSHHKTLPLH